MNIINKYGNYIIHNPNYKERVLDFLERQFFIKHIGIELTEILPGNTRCRLKVEEIHKQQHGFLHGGVIATMADVVAGCAAYTLVHEDHHVVTGEIKISYLNPGTGPNLLAVGWVLKQGRKINSSNFVRSIFCPFVASKGNLLIITSDSLGMVISNHRETK